MRAQSENEIRTLFLKEFTNELLKNSIPYLEIKPKQQPLIPKKKIKKIEEKVTKEIPKEIRKPQIETRVIENQEGRVSDLKIEKDKIQATKQPQSIPPLSPMHKPMTIEINEPKPQMLPQKIVTPPKIRPPQIPQNLVRPTITPYPISATSQRFNPQPVPTKLPENFSLGKLDILIRDPRVTVIECSGPLSQIIARTSGRRTITQIALTKEEIDKIIEEFSRHAKIPALEGNFKAAVGNLIINAVISKEKTSFIINKITPRFIIEEQERMLSSGRGLGTNYKKPF